MPASSRRRAGAALFVLLLAQAATGQAGKYQGVVTRVVDGDTLILRYLEHHYSVQLAGIDAPQGIERYAKDSADSLTRLCDRQTATVTARTGHSDAYGRILRKVRCNGVSANEVQLSCGMGQLEAPMSAPPSWRKLQETARAAGRGLWSRDEATPR